MRFYRASWEASQASEMRCDLNVPVRGGGGKRETISRGYWESQHVVDREKPFGTLL